MSKTFVRIKEMNTAFWEYIKIVSQTNNKTILSFIEEMAELHAKETKRTNLLNTLKEEYEDKI